MDNFSFKRLYLQLDEATVSFNGDPDMVRSLIVHEQLQNVLCTLGSPLTTSSVIHKSVLVKAVLVVIELLTIDI